MSRRSPVRGLRRTALAWVVSEPGQWTARAIAADLWTGGGMDMARDSLDGLLHSVEVALAGLRARGLVRSVRRAPAPPAPVWYPTAAGYDALPGWRTRRALRGGAPPCPGQEPALS